jgi:cytochrome c2
MVDTIIPFSGMTTLDIDPDKVLEAAKGLTERVIVIGKCEDGDYYFASSSGSNADNLWDTEQFKQFLLTGETTC